MIKKAGMICNLIAASMIFSACTVDAQLASSLLSSLQKSVTDNTNADGKVTLTPQNLTAAADAAGVRVVCGGKDMAIASYDDVPAEPAQLLADADTIQPVLLGPDANQGGMHRVQIGAELENDLRQLPKMAGQAREQGFRKIQGKHPQMRNARPVPVRGGQGQGRELVFAQIEVEIQGGHPGEFQGGRPPMGRPPMGGMKPPMDGHQGGHPGEFKGEFKGGAQGEFEGGKPVKIGPGGQGSFQPGGKMGGGKLMARPIAGFNGAQGSPCTLAAKEAGAVAAAAEATDADADVTVANEAY